MEMMMLGTLADSTRAATAMIGNFGTSRWAAVLQGYQLPTQAEGPQQRFVAVHESYSKMG
jgi:hypothetical protein